MAFCWLGNLTRHPRMVLCYLLRLYVWIPYWLIMNAYRTPAEDAKILAQQCKIVSVRVNAEKQSAVNLRAQKDLPKLKCRVLALINKASAVGDTEKWFRKKNKPFFTKWSYEAVSLLQIELKSMGFSVRLHYDGYNCSYLIIRW